MTVQRFEVRLTTGAERDVRDLHHYLRERHGEDAATAFLGRMAEAIGGLEEFPRRGTVPRELEAIGIVDFRQILSGVNRIIYRVIEQDVIVFVVADGRRDMQSLLERRMLIG